MMQTDNIPQDYESLLEEFKQRESTLETLQQKIYDYKRQLDNSQFLVEEYKLEIETLQNDKTKEQQKFEQKLLQIEENFNQEKIQLKEQINNLEQECAKKEEELLQNITTKTSKDDSIKESEKEIELSEEIQDLKQDNENLLFKNDELSVEIEELKLENSNLQEQLACVKNELNEVRELLNVKREELNEKDNLVQTLNDEICCLKNELETFKNKPLDQESQGNSLFAEVNDRRVYLENKIKNMKEHYLSMERERASLLQQISHLQNEKMKLSKDYKDALEEQEDDRLIIQNTYEERISVLEQLLKDAQNKLRERNVDSKQLEDHSVFKVLYKEKEKEIEALHDQLAENSLKRCCLGKSLDECHKLKRQWEFKATEYKTSMDILSEKLKELGYAYNNGTFVQMKPIMIEEKTVEKHEINVESENVTVKSILKEQNSTIDSKMEIGKNEGGKGNKRIAFDENTVEVNESNRVPTRRCNVIQCPPKKFISSVKRTK